CQTRPVPPNPVSFRLSVKPAKDDRRHLRNVGRGRNDLLRPRRNQCRGVLSGGCGICCRVVVRVEVEELCGVLAVDRDQLVSDRKWILVCGETSAGDEINKSTPLIDVS